MNTTVLESMLQDQEVELEKQKQSSREKVKKGKRPSKNFSLKRQDTLLRVPDNYAKEWFFCVPPYFNDALDIRLMERVKEKIHCLAWSQGSIFSFSAGDAVYDIPFEKGKCWAEDMKTLNICLQIEKASPVDLLGEGDETYRFPGRVECTVFTPDESRQRLVKRGQVSMTQDEFVKMLIAGPNEKIRPFLNAPIFDTKGQGLGNESVDSKQRGWQYKKDHLDAIAATDLHEHEEQIARQERAKKCVPVRVDKERQEAEILGEGKDIYFATLNDCSCMDFALRGLPCKHMYRLAHELGVRTLQDVEIFSPSDIASLLSPTKKTPPQPVSKIEGSFSGLTIVFTGKLHSMERKNAKALVEKHGGRVVGDVSALTSLLVAGEKAGSKLERARAIGVPVIDEKEFLTRVDTVLKRVNEDTPSIEAISLESEVIEALRQLETLALLQETIS